MEATKSPLTDESIKCGAYTYSGILFGLKKKKIPIHATTQMNFDEIKLSGIKQSQRTNTV